MLHRLKQGVKTGVRALADRIAPADPNRPVRNLGLDLTARPAQPRALVCYLDWTTCAAQLDAGAKHTNYREMFQIVQVLLRRGWAADVCLCQDEAGAKTLPPASYRLIFGFGSAFRAAAAANPQALKILYTTENPYDVSARNEQERIDYFAARHGKKTGFARSGLYYRPGDVEMADAVLSLGEISYYAQLQKPVLRLYPTALVCPDFHFDGAARPAQHFMVLGADGIIHKGFDLLVDVFSRHPEWRLDYYGRDFTAGLRRLGYGPLPANIRDRGFINVQSADFAPAAADNCYILLPSASEGCPTGVLTGMMHGLIPLVMKGNGLDAFGDICGYFPGYRLEEIEQTLAEAAAAPDAERAARSRAAYELARSTFTLEHFTDSFSAALDALAAALDAPL